MLVYPSQATTCFGANVTRKLTPMPDETEKKGLRLDASVNVGTLVQSLALVFTALWFVIGKANTAEQSVTDLKAFRAEVSVQFAELKLQTAPLPVERAAAAQVERRLLEYASAIANDAARIGKLEQSIYELKTDVANVRASLPSGTGKITRP